MTQSSFDGDSSSPPSTLRASFSQDCDGFPSSPRGAWHVPDDFGFEEEVDVDQVDETANSTSDEAGVSMMESLVVPNLSADASEACTEATETATSETDASVAVPTDYEPPRYFANPEPQERLSSSSWFKLWGSSSSSTKQPDSSSRSCGYNSDADAEMDETSEKPNRLFSKSRLFPRRASESCMSGGFLEKYKEADAHSRSMHG